MTTAPRVPAEIVAEILHRAGRSPHEEICGLVGGNAETLARCYPVRNAAPDPARRFAVDAAEQVDVMRAMRERGEELAAIYHSHPHGPPGPSPTDVAEHAYPDALCLIAAPGLRDAFVLHGYYIRHGNVTEVVLRP